MIWIVYLEEDNILGTETKLAEGWEGDDPTSVRVVEVSTRRASNILLKLQATDIFLNPVSMSPFSTGSWLIFFVFVFLLLLLFLPSSGDWSFSAMSSLMPKDCAKKCLLKPLSTLPSSSSPSCCFWWCCCLWSRDIRVAWCVRCPTRHWHQYRRPCSD